jgi:hypothetical protein
VSIDRISDAAKIWKPDSSILCQHSFFGQRWQRGIEETLIPPLSCPSNLHEDAHHINKGHFYEKETK